MTIRLWLPLVLLVAVISGGCVSKKKYVALQADYGKSIDTNRLLKRSWQVTQQELTESGKQVQSLEEQIAAAKANAAALQDGLNKCLAGSNQSDGNIAKLTEQITTSDKYIRHLFETNPAHSLTPDEKDVNVKVLKDVVFISLADNMLYQSGKYLISSAAGSILAKVAKIIRDYPNYDVLVEGNADDIPISQRNIRNNWDLSALRASSVVQTLQNTYHVDPKRLTAGGRGQYNPIADNSTNSGKSQNRRTEIIIMPKLEQFMNLTGKPAPSN